MCLTAPAFGFLLSLVSLSQLTVDEGRVTVHTPERDIHWLAVGEEWCTGQPDSEELAMVALGVRVI